jgi:hypothetical protein
MARRIFFKIGYLQFFSRMENEAISVEGLLTMIETVLRGQNSTQLSQKKHYREGLRASADQQSFQTGKFADALLPTPGYQCHTVSPPRTMTKSMPVWEHQAPLNTLTLPEITKVLEGENQARILCVRKIHKLGFRSSRYIRQHFAKFGRIDKLIILPSRQKEKPLCGGSINQIRPSSMCFIIMDTEHSARQALLQELHYVGEWPVEVTPYTPPSSMNVVDREDCMFKLRSASLSSFLTDVSC